MESARETDIELVPLVWDLPEVEFRCIDLAADGDRPPESAGEESASAGAGVPEGPVTDRAVPSPVAVSESERAAFLHGVARWTQIEIESSFVRIARRFLAFPLRVNTIVRLPAGRLPVMLGKLLTRLEDFVAHGCAVRGETAVFMVKARLVIGTDAQAAALAANLAALVPEPADLAYLGALAVYRHAGPAAALPLARQAAAHDAGGGNPCLLEAVCLSRTGAPEEACRSLMRALPFYSGQADILRFCLAYVGRYGTAAERIRVLEMLLRAAPDDAVVSGQLALALYDAGAHAAALPLLAARAGRADAGRDDMYRYGVALASLGREDEARDVLDTVTHGGPDGRSLDEILFAIRDAGLGDGNLIPLVADRMLASGNIRGCLDYCRKNEAASGSGLAVIMGRCYIQLADYAAALDTLARGSGGGERSYWTGLALFLDGRPAEAGPALDEALKAGCRVDSCRRMLGDIAAAAGDHARAAGYYRQVARVAVPDAQDTARYAYAALRAGMTHLAIEGFRDLVALVPDCAEAWNNLGVLLARREEYEAAARAFKTALGLVPGQAEAGRNLALVYDKVLRSRQAEYLERFVALETRTEGTRDG